MHSTAHAGGSPSPVAMQVPLYAQQVPTDVLSWQVIPMLSGDATEQTPPDLPSFLFKERIVYLVSDRQHHRPDPATVLTLGLRRRHLCMAHTRGV